MTTTTNSRFIEPLDVLFLRGNQLFGEPGSYGEALMPPWPSVAAGALRTRILSDDSVDMAAFAAGRAAHPQLGTPQAPGGFVLQGFQVACTLFAGLLAWATGLPWVTLLLGTSPGGITEMAITAKVLQLGVPVVTTLVFIGIPVTTETPLARHSLWLYPLKRFLR